MNWKKIIIFSLLITVIGTSYGVLLSQLGLFMPESFSSNYIWFGVIFLIPIPAYTAVYYFLSNSLESAQYKHSIAVYFLSSLYPIFLLYLIFGTVKIEITELVSFGFMAIAMMLGTGLGVKFSNRVHNA